MSKSFRAYREEFAEEWDDDHDARRKDREMKKRRTLRKTKLQEKFSALDEGDSSSDQHK